MAIELYIVGGDTMSKQEVLVSVIVPVFNTEMYLEQCIDSILNQTLKETEVIFVDDGSTDSSLRILTDYADKDERIRILKQKNKHAGAARNYGLENARGEYCIFLDSDDFFDHTMLEDLYKRCKEDDADICICRGRIYDEINKRIISANHLLNTTMIPEKVPFSWHDMPDKIFNFTSSAPWTKMFRRDFIQRENLKFQELKRANDLYFCNMALILARKITVVDKILVNYRKGNNSSLQATNVETPFDFYEAMAVLKKELNRRNMFKEVKQSFVNFCLGGCLYNLNTAKSEAAYKAVYERLQTEIFKELGVCGHASAYYYNQVSYEQMEEIMKNPVQAISLDKWKKPEQKVTTDPAVSLDLDDSLKISVIIPIYNVEQYIEECIYSVLNQTLKDLEVIFVNDGSLDNSMEIVEQFKDKDDRIIILNKENGGLSSARNAGMKAAHGEFILFLDSDDYLAEYALEHLYRQAKYYQLDELFYTADSFYDSIDVLKEYPSYHRYYKRKGFYPSVESGQNLFIKMKKNKDFKPSACLQMLNRIFLEENQIKFYEGIIHEDNLFTLQCISLAKRTKFIDEPLYMRRVREGSIMTAEKGWKNAYGYYITVKEMMRFIENCRFEENDYFLKELLDELSVKCTASASFLKGMEESEIESYIQSMEFRERIQFSVMIYSLYKSEKKAFKAKGKLEKEKKKLKTSLNAIRCSKTYRIGHIITWLPRKIVCLLRSG